MFRLIIQVENPALGDVLEMLKSAGCVVESMDSTKKPRKEQTSPSRPRTNGLGETTSSFVEGMVRQTPDGATMTRQGIIKAAVGAGHTKTAVVNAIARLRDKGLLVQTDRAIYMKGPASAT
jgi:L-asparaginase/Glu-tRNA(Gln) amidotransferase subunit D